MRRVDGYCSRQAPREEAPRAEVAGSERFEQISQPPVAGRRGEQDALAGVEPPSVRVVVDHRGVGSERLAESAPVTTQSAGEPLLGFEKSPSLYGIASVVGFPMHLAAHAAYTRVSLVPWIVILAWSLLLNAVIAREVFFVWSSSDDFSVSVDQNPWDSAKATATRRALDDLALAPRPRSTGVEAMP